MLSLQRVLHEYHIGMGMGLTFIDALRAGDETAYKELFERFFKLLHQIATVYVMDSDTANDIVQDVFISVFEHSDKLANVANLESYLRISVRNRCLNHLRTLDLEDRNNRLYFEELSEIKKLEDNNPSEVESMMESVRKILDTLPENCRRICEMRFIDGLKIKEIASLLSLSDNTVKVQLHRGVEKVREEVAKQALFDNKEQRERFLVLLTLFL